ncbi:MAG TPA: DNA replication and repair protein RecF [Thermoanaerobaculia bacterium]|nr:DNA replication and repair protein RecF [Thermoanaerobaculia bacterium]
MLRSLAAQSFRNLADGEHALEPGATLLLGGNGAGKTSILEAIYLLATTRSFRTSQLTDCCRHGAGTFHLVAEVETDLRSRLEIHFGEAGRERLINGRSGTLAEHLTVLPVVAWTAADVEALTGPPRLRRRLLDRGVLGLRPSAVEGFARFRQALAEKRALLLSGGAGLEAWNQILAREAAEIARQRADYQRQLGEAFQALLSGLALRLPAIELTYRPSPATALQGEAALLAAFEQAAGEERRRAAPLVGPQRDELAIVFRGTEVKRAASAGERKAIALLLAAAHGRVLAAAGRLPVYLLDDLDTELSRALLAEIWPAFGDAGQLLVTSNRPEVWQGLTVARRWSVESGSIYA